jgi:hypothetical protein
MAFNRRKRGGKIKIVGESETTTVARREVMVQQLQI